MGVALQSTSIHAEQECVSSVGVEMVDGIAEGKVGVKIDFTTCDDQNVDWLAIYKVPDEDEAWKPKLSPEFSYEDADESFKLNEVDFFAVKSDSLYEVYDLSYFAEGLHKVYLFDKVGASSNEDWTYKP